jgi:WD40 repeat protein
LAFVGDGKKEYAHVISDSGNTIGKLTIHTQMALSCDMKAKKPYKIMTSGTDSELGFFSGIPFKLIGNNKNHKGAVHCIRISPDYSTIVSVSQDKSIQIIKAEDESVLHTIENAHKGSILSCAWFENETFVTGSADGTIKVWDLATQ